MTVDNKLVTRILEGDTQAFEKIVEAYKNKLFSFLYKMTRNRQDAEELLQEVFIKAYRSLHQYRDRWMFSTWIYRIAANTCKSYMKKNKRMMTVPIQEHILYDDVVGDNPEEIAHANEKRREIVELIQSLKEKQRTPLILKYVKGFSYFEIGRIMGISEEAAKMKVQRARENICKRYSERHRGDAG